jgi:hypothetical protein
MRIYGTGEYTPVGWAGGVMFIACHDYYGRFLEWVTKDEMVALKAKPSIFVPHLRRCQSDW